MPLRLDEGWNQIQLNLADYTRRAYGTNYVETLNVQVHANCLVQRIYISDRLYSKEELPSEFKLYLPMQPQDSPGMGELALGPLMFGSSSTLLNASHYDVYFKGMPSWNGLILRRHGDVFERTSRGYYHAHGRADDTMNIGGIKVSSVEIERICNAVDSSVLETAAIGVPPADGGLERLVIAVVLKDPDNSTPNMNQLRISFNSAVQKNLNPLFRVSHVVALSSLPRTATNKVMRRVLRKQLAEVDQNSKL